MIDIGLGHYLTLGAIIFTIGVVGPPISLTGPVVRRRGHDSQAYTLGRHPGGIGSKLRKLYRQGARQ